MSETHAMAMVSWDEYRRNTKDHYHPPEFFYCCEQQKLVKFVGNGGTLWAATSQTIDGQKQYSLAFKLVNCAQRTPDSKKRKKYGRFMIQSCDWRHCQYFSFKHDATDTLRKLSFKRPAPMPSSGRPGKIGSYLQTISKLTEDSVKLLQSYEEKILTQRKVFISYAHKDEDEGKYLSLLEKGLDKEGINTWSDLSGLRAGDTWRTALKRVASNTDCVLVLVSAASARSDWVKKEVAWAIKSHNTTKLVKLIIPILLDSESIREFDNLSDFQYEQWNNNQDFFRKVAEQIVDATPRGYTGSNGSARH